MGCKDYDDDKNTRNLFVRSCSSSQDQFISQINRDVDRVRRNTWPSKDVSNRTNRKWKESLVPWLASQTWQGPQTQNFYQMHPRSLIGSFYTSGTTALHLLVASTLYEERDIATIIRSGYSEHESCLALTTITVPVDYGRLKRTPYRCGTCRDARPRLTILNSPSPRMSPLARIMMGVSDCLRQLRQYQLINPPIVRAMVKDGVLYMPK